MERCDKHDEIVDKLAALDKQLSMTSMRLEDTHGEVMEMKAEMQRFESKIDGLPEQIISRMPKIDATPKPWYLGDKAMNAAILSLILAAAKLLEKLAQ